MDEPLCEQKTTAGCAEAVGVANSGKLLTHLSYLPAGLRVAVASAMAEMWLVNHVQDNAGAVTETFMFGCWHARLLETKQNSSNVGAMSRDMPGGADSSCDSCALPVGGRFPATPQIC